MIKDMKIGIDAVTIDRPKSSSIDDFIKSFLPQVKKAQKKKRKNKAHPLLAYRK